MLRVAVAALPATATADAGLDWLGEAERRRWADLSPAARRRFAASRALLRTLLQSATGVAAAGWELSAQAGEAPRAWPRVAADALSLHVSLSHRLDWVAAAVATTPVGVDLDCERPARSDPQERAALMLAAAERPAWEALPAGAREPALLARWTAKEAWFKSRPTQDAAWDFRRVVARACAPADPRANVRTWQAAGVHLALCCDDAAALAQARCEGLPAAAGMADWWHVAADDPD